METQGNEVHIERDEARAGSTPGIVRYVLGISLVLVVIALGVVFMTGALTADHSNNSQDNSKRAVSEQQQKPQQ